MPTGGASRACRSWLAISSTSRSLGGNDRVASSTIYYTMACSSNSVSFLELGTVSCLAGWPVHWWKRVV